jgi:predicted membrane metal-binding protein
MPLLLLGFFLLTSFWLFWALAWMVVWAVAFLFWPLALLVGGGLLWRARARWQRSIDVRAHELNGGRPAAPNRKGAFANGAFEDYRAETLRRLDEESGKFREFLERLRKSRDRREFEAYMSARRGRPAITQGDAAAS